MFFIKKHKHKIILSLALIIAISLEGICFSSYNNNAPPKISAKSAILMDAKTGQILYEKDADKKLPPASTTKILTAIIALESGRLNDMVKVSPKAAAVRGSSLHLHTGQILTLEELVTGLLLRSGNDAAEAIAEHLSGTVENFAIIMNQKAAVLGAKNSHFKNPHGLNHPDHVTTTLDLANITRYALSNPKFAKIVSTKETDIEWFDLKGKSHEDNIRNTNRLLWMLGDADGVKTGTTSQAGPCLVSSATRGNQKIIAVVLNDKSRWHDSAELLKYALETFEYIEYAKTGSIVASVPVESGMNQMVNAVLNEDANLTIKKGDYPSFKAQIKMLEKIKAPVFKGQKIGEIIFEVDNKVVKTVDLTAEEYVEEKTFTRIFFKNMLNFTRQLSSWGVI